MNSPPTRPVPAWLRHWENLHILVQVAIIAPLAFLLMFVAHIGLMNQPLWRGISYGIFWGALVTAAVVGATRSERARREHGGVNPRQRRSDQGPRR